MAQTPARMTRSCVKAARARGEAEDLLVGLPATSRGKAHGLNNPARTPLADVQNTPQAAAATDFYVNEHQLDEAPSLDTEAAAVAVTPSPMDVRKEAAMAAQTPAMSDLERLLLSPDAHMTPETAAKRFTGKSRPAAASLSPDRWQIDNGLAIKEPTPQPASEEAVPPTVLKSKVVVPEKFDPRSLRQLKKEYQDLKVAQAATVVKAAAATSMPDNHSSDDKAEVVAAAEPDSAATAAAHSLSTALGSLTIGPTASGSRIPLRGVPIPELGADYRYYRKATMLAQGKHMRFEDEGARQHDRTVAADSNALISPSKPVLRGLPTAAGSHLRFDD